METILLEAKHLAEWLSSHLHLEYFCSAHTGNRYQQSWWRADKNMPLVAIVTCMAWDVRGRRSDTCRKFDIRVIFRYMCGLSDQGQDWLHYILFLAGQHHLSRIRSIFPCISNITHTHTPVIKEFTCSHTCLYWWLHESCTLGTHMQWGLNDAL